MVKVVLDILARRRALLSRLFEDTLNYLIFKGFWKNYIKM